MKVKAIRCLDCGETVWSRHRHDLRFCSCGKCGIDGGRDYTRTLGVGEVVEINVESKN